MSELLVAYARCSTDDQDLPGKRDALIAIGVTPKRIYVDHGRTGTNRARPGVESTDVVYEFLVGQRVVRS